MQVGTLIAGKYRVERILGRGGMGVVVEATHVDLETRFALKFLDPALASDATAVARFKREGQAPYLVMELLAGTDLARVSKIRALDVPTAALYVKQACSGLAEAHAAGIV